MDCMSATDDDNWKEDEEQIEEDGDEKEYDERGEQAELGFDEAYCTSCGEVIKQEAEICPNCGVRQFAKDSEEEPAVENPTRSIPDSRVYDLQKIARKSPGVAVALGILLTPAAYWYVDRTGLAIINLLTFNYLLLGFIIVPIHSYMIIEEAKEELGRNGETW